MPCILWTPQDDGDGANAGEHSSSESVLTKRSHAGALSSTAPDSASAPAVGDLLRVKGRITSYCGQVQLSCTSYGAAAGCALARCDADPHAERAEVITDPHVELLHWLDAAGSSAPRAA